MWGLFRLQQNSRQVLVLSQRSSRRGSLLWCCCLGICTLGGGSSALCLWGNLRCAWSLGSRWVLRLDRGLHPGKHAVKCVTLPRELGRRGAVLLC